MMAKGVCKAVTCNSGLLPQARVVDGVPKRRISLPELFPVVLKDGLQWHGIFGVQVNNRMDFNLQFGA